MPRVLPAALGAVETTVLREAGAYASIDEGGREVVPTLIDSVQDPDGHVVWRPSAIDCTECCDARPARRSWWTSASRSPIAASVFQLVTMMQGVTTRGTGVPVAAGLGSPDRRQDRHDAGFHRRLVLRLHARPGDHRVGRLRQSRRRWATTRPAPRSPGRSGTTSWRSR